MGRALAAMVWSPFISQDFAMLLAEINTKDLETLSQLIESGKVTPVIDQVFPLSQVPAAIRYLEDGHARGKVIITPRSRDATS
jgi:NADPH:quinone reductase-like Zn-dependent oxidoreductase